MNDSTPDDEATLRARIDALLAHIERLEEAVERDGATVTGGNGQPTAHPALKEIRALSLAVGKLIAVLRQGSSPTSAAAAQLARKRWRAPSPGPTGDLHDRGRALMRTG